MTTAANIQFNLADAYDTFDFVDTEGVVRSIRSPLSLPADALASFADEAQNLGKDLAASMALMRGLVVQLTDEDTATIVGNLPAGPMMMLIKWVGTQMSGLGAELGNEPTADSAPPSSPPETTGTPPSPTLPPSASTPGDGISDWSAPPPPDSSHGRTPS